jgi:hypothetical protein
VGLAVQAAKYFFPVDPTPQEEALEQQIEQLKHQKVIEKIAAKQAKVAGPRKLRIADSAPIKHASLDADAEALAEEEALAEARQERRRRRSR